MDDWIKVQPAADDWAPVRGPGSAAPNTPPIGDLPPGAQPGPPFAKLAQEPMNQTPRGFTMDDAVYLSQSPNRGLGNLVGAPVDIATMLMNLASSIGTKAVNLALPDDRQLEPYQIQKPFGGSEFVRDASADAYEAAGGKVVAPEEVGMTTRVAGNAIDFGVQGLTGGTGLAAAAGRKAAKEGVERLGPVMQEYAKRPVGTTVVDTAGGAGAGMADQTAQEYDIQNPIVRFLLASAGGWGGARTAQLAAAPGAATRAMLDRVLMDPNVPPDQLRGFSSGVSRRDANAAAETLQGAALDPQRAAQSIRDELQIAREQGWTPPTSGQMSNDPGLLVAERRARLQSPTVTDREAMAGAPVFVQRDRAVQDDLTQAVAGLAPADGKPRVPTDLVTQQARTRAAELEAARSRALEAREGAQAATATAQAEMAAEREARLAAARQRVAEAEKTLGEARTAERELGGTVQANLGGKSAASENLATAVSEAKNLDEAHKRGLYQQAQTMSEGVTLPVGDLGADVAAIKAELAPLVGHDRAVSNAIPDLDLLAGEGVAALPLNKVIAMLPRLSAAGEAATRNMRGDVAKAVASIENDLKSRIRTLADRGNASAMQWAAAEENFRTNFAPKYREGVGRKMDRAERAGVPVPPSAQAGLFLRPRGGGKEAAEDLNRILRGAPTEAAGQAAARDYVMADLASLVADNGTITPNRLRAWVANHEGMLSQLPAVRTEVQKLLVDVVNRRESTNTTKATLDALVAERRGVKEALDRREKQITANARLNEKQKATELAKIDQERAAFDRHMQTNAVRHLIDADPDHAVAAVLGSRDPERAMAQIVDRLKSDPEAVKGWKRAVADHLYRQVRQQGAPDTPQGFDPVSLGNVSRVLDENRAALAKVFSPQEMHVLTRVQRVLDVASRKGLVTSTAAPPAPNSMAMGLVEIALKTIYGGLQGGNKLRNLKVAMQIAPGAPLTARVDRLVERAMLDPELMLHLLEVPVKESLIPSWNRGLNRILAATNVFARPEDGE